MQLGHRRRNSISCCYFSGENVNRQNNQPISETSWWPLILTPIYTYETYAFVRHLFKSCNAFFKRKMSNHVFFFNIAMMKIPWGSAAFWLWNTNRASDAYIFWPRRNRKMSRNDVTVDHRCNGWFLIKFHGDWTAVGLLAEQKSEHQMEFRRRCPYCILHSDV